MTTEAETSAMSDEAALLDYLRERDVACPLCRYNLRGLNSARCPECGRELRLGVWLAEPRQAAWVVTLVPLLLSAGIGLLILIGTALHGWGGEPLLVRITFFYFLGAIPTAGLLIWKRRAFLRLAHASQWTIAGAAVTAFLIALGMVMSEM